MSESVRNEYVNQHVHHKLCATPRVVCSDYKVRPAHTCVQPLDIQLGQEGNLEERLQEEAV